MNYTTEELNRVMQTESDLNFAKEKDKENAKRGGVYFWGFVGIFGFAIVWMLLIKYGVIAK
jgi:hypothetical protein